MVIYYSLLLQLKLLEIYMVIFLLDIVLEHSVLQVVPLTTLLTTMPFLMNVFYVILS